MIIEFPEYLPDLPDLNNPGTTVANNVVPAGRSYRQMPSFNPTVQTAVDDYVRGNIFVRDPTTGQSANFVGTGTKLYKGSSTTWTDVSVAGGYVLGTDELWSFTQFDNDVIAVNIDTPLMTYDLDTSSLFATLIATINARYVTTIRDFVMIANTNDSVDGEVPNRVRWSAINDPTSWAVSATTQADYQDLDSQGGWITGLVGGDYAIIFQERAITRMDYVGSPLVFQFNTLVQNNGTVIPKSIITIGTITYFRGIDGFYAFDGTHAVAIGSNKVDLYFDDNFNSSFPDRVSVAADYGKNLIFWLYPSVNSATGTPDSILVYNYSPNAQRRWSTITFTLSDTPSVDTSISYIMSAYTYGYTLEELDTPFNSNIDQTNMPSLDSRVWTGQNLILSGFNRQNKFGTFESACYTGVITTAEFEINDGERTELHRFKPVIDGSVTTITARVGYRQQVTDAITYSSVISLNSLNEAVCRINARYFRIEVTIAGGAWDAIGLQVLEARKVGIR